MKKFVLFALTACLMLSLIGCGGNGGTETTKAPNPSTPVETTPAGADGTTASTTEGTEAPTEAPAAEGFLFNYNGTEIAMHAPAAPIVEALGEPKKYTESASCAFEGLDKTYYYGSFYLDTYPMGEEDFVYGWWFADDSLTTEEGIYIGATQAQVEAAYGADAFNGTNAYTVTKGDTMLTVILEDGVVTSIQYAIILT